MYAWVNDNALRVLLQAWDRLMSCVIFAHMTLLSLLSARRPWWVLFLLLVAAPALAHDGESHGVTTVVVDRTLEPRFEVKSAAIEITGILKEERLWLFVAHFANNEPWNGLRIELEGGDRSISAVPAGDGIYRADVPELAQPGRHAITLALQGTNYEELLTGELIVVAGANTFTRWTWSMVLAVMGIAGAGYVLWRRKRGAQLAPGLR